MNDIGYYKGFHITFEGLGHISDGVSYTPSSNLKP